MTSCLELGVGFAFVGSQYPLEVGGQEFRIDLLFYHLRLRAYVVIELKVAGLQAGVQRQDVNFEFLTLAKEAHERDLERALINHLRDFLLELGIGFAFVGSQYPIEVGGQEFRVDLLFYHLRLRAYVVVELKAQDFKPEFSGKMNFYLSAIDDLLRHPDDQASIGIILCKSKNKVVAEYALRDLGKPVGISEYRFTEGLPKRLQESLPTVEQLEAELKDRTKT